MLPLSTGNTKGCTPISSNCIIWQGPDLNCINVCNGDTISTVVAKVAELVCSLIDTGLSAAVDMTSINHSCILPEDPSNVDNSIQAIVQNTIFTACNNLTNISYLQDTVNSLIQDIDDITLLQGPQGPIGLTGNIGASGNDGLPGDQGPQGPQGETGCSVTNIVDNGNGTFTIYYCNETFVVETLQGVEGAEGLMGPAGPAGPQGAEGAAGTTGPAGEVGAVGPAGPAGTSIVNTIDNGDGTFTWFYSDGTSFTGTSIMGPEGPAGAIGAVGPQGETGAAGLDSLVAGPVGPVGPEGPGGVMGPTGPMGPTGGIGSVGPQGEAGAAGLNGDPGADGQDGNPGNINVKIPQCIIDNIGTLTDYTGDTPVIMTGDDIMLLHATLADGGGIWTTAYSEVIYNYDGVENTYWYSGWADLVNQKLCCLLEQSVKCQPFSATSSGIEHIETSQPRDNSSVSKLPIITSLKNRIITLERKGNKSAYVPKKVLAKYVGNKVGQRIEMHELLTALETDYGKLRKAIGSSAEVLKAAKGQCANLAAEDRLSGNGVYSTLNDWHTAPSNLAQSVSNAWKMLCDIRTAVSTLQTTVTPSGCIGFTYDPRLSLTKDGSGNVNGIKLLFTECIIPSGFQDCDKTKGSKITIEDSSLNTSVEYVNITNLSSSSNGYTIGNLASRGLDISSNFKVRIDFCFTDGSNQCERTMDFTLENTSACPTVTLTTTGETSIEYSVTGLSTNSKATYEIIVENQTGSTISKQTIKSPSTTSTTGKAAGLVAGTSYDIYVRTTSLAGNVSNCDKATFTTTAPVCTSYSKVSTDYKTKIADLGSTTITVATYKSGTITTAWIIGFDAVTGLPQAYKGTDSTETGTEATFILNTTPISDNPTTSINCGNVAYAATGMTTLMNSNENGWQYIDAIVATSGVTYYVYALANTGNHTIDQVVFCCDCKPSYVRTKYGDTSTASTSEAYSPDRHAWYVVADKTLRIPIDIIGYSTQTTPIKWNATSALGGTTSFILPTDSGYDSSLGGTVQLNYAPSGTSPSGGIDSVDVYAETDCTVGNEGNRTVNTVTIPIVNANTLQNTNTDITVFVDTNVISLDEATTIKTEIDRVKTTIQSNCSTWTGTVNYVPVTGSSSGDYLDYTKAMVDMKGGASGSVTVNSAYSTFKSLPAYWSSGSSEGIPSTVYLICFIGNVNSNGNYGGATLSNGWGVQPTSKYQQNYDELLDILYVNGAARTTWGLAQGCTYKKFDLKQVLIPVVSGSQDASAATVLQTAGALTGTVLSQTGINGFPTGSIKNPINIIDYIGPNSSQMVPYTGTTVGGANTISGLSTYGFTVMPFIDKSYLETDSNLQSGGDQSNFLGNAVLRVTGVDSSGMNLTSDTKCPTGSDSVQLMTGTLDGTAVSIYGNDTSDPTNCTKAGTAAITAGNCIPIYNSSGVQFDPNVPAYLTISGGNAGEVTAQLADGVYYAQHGAASTNAVRRIAQYDRDGATTGIYWVNQKYVAGC